MVFEVVFGPSVSQFRHSELSLKASIYKALVFPTPLLLLTGSLFTDPQSI